ncbi:MAG: hypothetical protein DBY45_04655 [Clostridiales bacterium]|nr:MAG: hypothetical protein DBY45_04655 [Clostridiales bacterium]
MDIFDRGSYQIRIESRGVVPNICDYRFRQAFVGNEPVDVLQIGEMIETNGTILPFCHKNRCIIPQL